MQPSPHAAIRRRQPYGKSGSKYARCTHYDVIFAATGLSECVVVVAGVLRPCRVCVCVLLRVRMHLELLLVAETFPNPLVRRGPTTRGDRGSAENASKRLLDVGAACRLDSGRLLQLYGHSKLQVTWRFWAWVWLRCRMLLPNQVDAQQAIIQRMRQQLAAVTNAIARHGRPGG